MFTTSVYAKLVNITGHCVEIIFLLAEANAVTCKWQAMIHTLTMTRRRSVD